MRRFDVEVVRWIDGHRIPVEHPRTCGCHDDPLTAGEVLVLHIAEECLPGTVAAFTVRKHPRPWEPRAPAGPGVGSGPSDAETTGRATRPFPTDRTTRRFDEHHSRDV